MDRTSVLGVDERIPSGPLSTSEPINGRYRIIRQLGAGGLGSVYLVEDTVRDGRRLALKTLRPGAMNARAANTLKTEFLVLSGLRHPGIAEVHDFGRNLRTGGFFFTSSFVDGSEWREFLSGRDLSAGDDREQFYDLVAQVLRALEFVHSRGIVHGDLKPENILIERSEPGAATAKLIDFGLVRQEKDFVGRNAMGTLNYVAPEVISGSQIDRRTDLYSIGAVLYSLISGRSLFDCKSHLSILRAQLERQPAPLSQLVPSIDPRLEALISQLLEKSPARRPQSALEVLSRLGEITRDGLPLETSDTRRAYLLRAPVAAHDRHEQALYRACVSGWKRRPKSDLDGTMPGTSGDRVQLLGSGGRHTLLSARAVLLFGEHGLGQAAIARRFRARVQIAGAAFVGSTAREENPGERREACAAAEDCVAVLREIAAIERALLHGGSPDSQGGRLTDFLTGLATRAPDDAVEELRRSAPDLARYIRSLSYEQPLVVWLDRLDRSTAALRDLVAALLQEETERAVPDGQVFIAGSLEDTSLGPDDTIVAWAERLEEAGRASLLRMDRLDRREVAELVRSVFKGHSFPDSFLRTVAAKSDGNPAAILSIFEHLFEASALERTTDGWRVSAEVPASSLPVHVRDELEAVIRGLPRTTIRMGMAFAFLGEGADVELAAQFSRVDQDAAQTATEDLVRRRLLRPLRDRGYVFHYRSAREILYAKVPPADRPEFHRRAGILIKSLRPDFAERHPEAMWRHFLRGKSVEDALAWARAAAERFAAEGELDRAVGVWLDTAQLAKSKGCALPADACHALGTALVEVGRFREALVVFRGLVDSSGLPAVLRARTHTAAAEAHTVLGDFDAARVQVVAALDALESLELEERTRARAETLLARARLNFVQGEYVQAMADCTEVLRLLSRTTRRSTTARALSLLAETRFALGETERAVTACREALQVFDATRSRSSSESVLVQLARIYKYRDRFSEARMVLLFCGELRGKMGDPDGEARALTELGGLNLFLGRFREASTVLRRAATLFRRTGNRVALSMALNLLAEALRTTGEYEESRKTLQQATELAAELDNPLGSAEALIVEARLSLDEGDVQRAGELLEDCCATSPAQPRSYLKGLDIRCQILACKGDFSTLHVLASKALDLARRHRLPLHEARFLEHLGETQLRLGNLIEAKDTASALGKIATDYALPLSHGRALLVEASVAVAEDRSEAAEEKLSEAKELFLSVRSERDLVRLYAQYGAFLTEQGDLTRAFCYLQEGTYLSRKLRLHYWECRLTVLRGELVLRSDEPDPDEARAILQRAEHLAERGRYGDLLWKIRRTLVSLTPGTGSYFASRD